MIATPPTIDQPRNLIRRLAPLLAVVLLAVAAYFFVGRSGISLAALVKNRAAIGAFVAEHHLLAVLAYIALYVVAVALSLPGAVFLTVSGGFLFGLAVGASAAVIGATIGATVIFLIARTALGEPLLRRAGPRAAQLAQGFREDAFSYLLFLRLVPAFPFFLVNLVPAFAGVRLLPFVTATALGVIPGAVVYALAGTGLDSVIAAQQDANSACLAAGRTDCRMIFDAKDILTPQLIGALIALGLLALVPVIVKRLKVRSRPSP
ncbi:MAG: TVP38/TMEM64 family protein [Pseudolabrys sp.]